jgi:fibro-slime domain-containing protein
MFFPIPKDACLDNPTAVESGRRYNYSFTLELLTTFFYEGGETFDIVGDDDIWIFINNRLAVDLGGKHSAAPAKLVLDDLAADLKLTKGEEYPFHLFFAERKSDKSSLAFQTNMKVKPQAKIYAYQALAVSNDGSTEIQYQMVEPVLNNTTLDSSSGRFTFQPDDLSSFEQNAEVRIKARNGKGDEIFQCFTITSGSQDLMATEVPCSL